MSTEMSDTGFQKQPDLQKHVTFGDKSVGTPQKNGSLKDFDFQKVNNDDNDNVSDEDVMPRNGHKLIVTICFVNLFANSAYSSIAPFYPGEAISKGVHASMLGMVFSCYSVAMLVFSPLFKKMLDRYGSKKVLIYGLLCEGIAMCVFGLFDFIQSPGWYVGASMFCRFLEGFGNGCLNSGSANLLLNVFPPKKLAKLNGILQTFTGLGMLMGPVMGSVLFNIGGFQLPFYTVGILLLVLCQVINKLIDSNMTAPQVYQETEEDERNSEINTNMDMFTFWAVLAHFDIWTCAMCHAISLFCLTFKEPILALLLTQYGLSINAIGCIFSIDTIFYTIGSMGLQLVKEEENGKKYGRLQYYGCLLFTIAMMCSGPAMFLPNKLSIVCLGISIAGLGGSLINNNSNAAMIHTEMKESRIKLGAPLSETQAASVRSSIASITTGAFGLGSIMGPILGGLLTDACGFRLAFEYGGLIVFALSFLQLYSQFVYKRPREKEIKEGLIKEDQFTSV